MRRSMMGLATAASLMALSASAALGEPGGWITAEAFSATVPMQLLSNGQYTDSAGFAHFVGEVKNVGGQAAEFIRITFNEYDASNNLLATDFTYTDVSGLYPNEQSPFDNIS